MLRKHLH